MAKKAGGLGKGLDALFLDNDAVSAADGGMTLRLSEIEPNKNQPRKQNPGHRAEPKKYPPPGGAAGARRAGFLLRR